MINHQTVSACQGATYNADRLRNCEMLVEAMKARIIILRIELRDALFLAYGAEINWPPVAVAALGDMAILEDGKKWVGVDED